MICARCLSRLSRTQAVAASRALPTTTVAKQHFSAPRSFSRVPSHYGGLAAAAASPPAAAPAAVAGTSPSIPPAAQPLTTPPAMSPGTVEAAATAGSGAHATTAVFSSVPAGTPLTGLNIYNDREAPMAMEDSAYPEWLWSVLDEMNMGKKGDSSGNGTGTQSKRASRKAAKKAAKNAKEVEVQIPLDQQTIDLPVGDRSNAGNAAAVAARGQLTKALRVKSRASIKERNFLATMR